MVNETIEQFLARGGKITRVESGVSSIADTSRIYAAMRSGERIAADSVEEARRAERRAEQVGERFQEALHSGWSRADAHDLAEG
jgi:hypothetical protein